MVEIATQEQKQAFFDMWQNCFGDSETFMNWLFEKRFLADFSTYIKKENKMVCCMQSYPFHIWVRGNLVKGVMLCGVCTDPKYRKQGLMTELFHKTMNILAQREYVLAVHTPAVLKSYYPFGHFAVNRCKYIKSDNIAHFTKSDNIVEINQNFAALYQCYEQFSKQYTGCISRTMADFLLKIDDYKADGAKIIAYEYNKEIKGYAIFYCTESILQAVETIAQNDAIYQKLIEGICCYGEGKKLSVKLPEEICVKADSLYEEIVEKGVAGILDVQKLMSTLCTEQKGYAIQIEDTVIQKNNGVFDLDGTATTKSADIKLSIGNAVQLFFGYSSLKELQQQNAVEIYHSENAKKIEQYYKKQKCYIVDEY